MVWKGITGPRERTTAGIMAREEKRGIYVIFIRDRSGQGGRWVLLLLLLMTGTYTPLLGSREAGDMLGAFLFLVGAVYGIVTVAAGLISKIRWSVGK